MARLPSLSAAVTSMAIAVVGGLAPITVAATAQAAEAPRTATVVGSLQSEAGCVDDWAPSCAATELTRVGDSTEYSRELRVPAGTYEFKVAINKAWDESYGAGGVKDGANIPLVLKGPATLTFSYDDVTHKIGVAPTDLPGEATKADRALAGSSLRSPLSSEQMYFLMADRFANGSSVNDAGGLTGSRLETGLDATDKGFFHGGDLAGVTKKLDYIKSLGTTAIWLTPTFKNQPVQGTGADASAGYHGYWITDFTRIDPHLGTNAEMKSLISAAHAKGMKVFFDIITNHTADVIDYQGGKHAYVSKEASPYKDASGTAFDDKAYAGGSTFPALNPATSFPYVPIFGTEAEKTAKTPAWLNDPSFYHNRGDSTFAGESSEYGDFVGLDDLFTEQPKVVAGMTDIYKNWVDFGIDGFRIDTVKHVNTAFWQKFAPAIQAEAKAKGKPDFFMFGEVYDSNPSVMSQFTTTAKLPATLDFGFQAQALAFAQGKPTTGLRDLYAADDYYTDTDSNAYQLPTFLGNHDMGRAAMMLTKSGSTGNDLMARTRLANDLMFLTRGQPVVYYGDEQGFIGAGGDKDARQDMFATKVSQYAGEQILGGTPGSKDRFDPKAPLYQQISALGRLRAANPGLTNGAQIHRYASDAAGIYAFSRVDAASGTEYLVVANNSTSAKSATFATYGKNATFAQIYGGRTALTSGKDTRVTASLPALSVSVWKAQGKIAQRKAAPATWLTSPQPGAAVGGRAEISAALTESAFAQVTFAVRPVGTSPWRVLGTDDNAPYRVFDDVSALAKGTLLEYRAITRDSSGNVSAASSYGVVGEPAKSGGGGTGGVGPVTQPDNVSVAGSHNSEMGCTGDWQPECAQAQLALDAKDQIWKGKFSTIPAGSYEYKAAIDKKWDESYGASGGGNIAYTTAGANVSFYYDHATHWATSDAQGPIITAPGSFQSELGCAGDWSPDCMRPWLQDPDGDGTYTWSTDQIPVGSYEFKVAHGLKWGEDYGADGVPGGSNVALSVPSAGSVVTISYVLATHQISVKNSKPGATPDLVKAKAFWVGSDLMAWPATAVPAGANLALLNWRLHWSSTGGLAVDAESVTGGSVADLTYDAAGLPAAVVAAHPELKGYLALRLNSKTARQAGSILQAQVAVALYDDLGRLLDATGVQTPGVLDDLYGAAATRTYGVTWKSDSLWSRSPSFTSPSFTLWAPTAQKVSVLLWPAAASAEAPASQATRVLMTRRPDGSWGADTAARWRGARYLFEVVVFAPTTGKVETNLVTDPYSVALTLNSTRSVAVNLADPALKPAIWKDSSAPVLKQRVDQTIYELHVRDFSVNDATVPDAHRGSYLAFADNGDGTRHLKSLAAAGLNTIHLLPTFDIASIEEDPARQLTPACDLASFAPDSQEQQKCVTAAASKDAFNWGYDPFHWMAPEGSYASSATAADGGSRVSEFRTMVGGLHADGLRVVLDQVFNHTATSGQASTSVLDKVVPGYYQRLNASGAVETSTCCQNVATEHAMAQKIMVDSAVSWVRNYRVDGFRYDLMGHHSKANMLATRAALDRLTLAADGVDGKAVTLYGEGWNFGEVANGALFTQAAQGNLGGTGIATFSDRLRDGVRGGGPFDEDPRKQGFGSGEATDPNGAPINAGATASLAHDTDLVQLGLAGNLRSFSFRDNASGAVVSGDKVDYNGAPAGYADQPDEVVSYVDAHDNETLFDSLMFKLPPATSMADRVRMNSVSLATTALSQTPSFWHAGADLLRSKSLNRDSYDSGDWFNTLDWTGADNGFGHGLPPEAVNAAKWPFMRPLLANPALRPSAAQVQSASAQAHDLLRLRFSSPLFRLGSAPAINARVTFPVSGSAEAHQGVIVMRVDDTVGADVDPALEGLVVVFNGSAAAVDQKLPGMAGAGLVLSPVQATGADAVVKASSWDSAASTLSVPARTVAVFVQR
ncbi:MAG: pullulanase-type alpha-1,6-glucosidase [Dermatophilaceae bacterium]|nr:pullulanase-type alpha-1,6-glucosidase [Dermatophilaceae bacterium]